MPRTNNVAEGWHHAHRSMTGVNKPDIFKFIENLKKDEDLSRIKMHSCNTGLPAAPKAKVYRDRDNAIKNCIEDYLEKTNKADEQDEEKEEEKEEEEEMDQSEKQRKKWLDSPEFALLNAMASIGRLDNKVEPSVGASFAANAS